MNWRTLYLNHLKEKLKKRGIQSRIVRKYGVKRLQILKKDVPAVEYILDFSLEKDYNGYFQVVEEFPKINRKNRKKYKIKYNYGQITSKTKETEFMTLDELINHFMYKFEEAEIDIKKIKSIKTFTKYLEKAFNTIYNTDSAYVEVVETK